MPGGKIDENVLDELETRLIAADVGIETTEKILGSLRKRVSARNSSDLNALLGALRSAMLEILQPVAQPLVIDRVHKPFVVLVVGVNGSGKTTTIGKLARRFTSDGRKVMLAAGDTFRAAAIEQLQVWGRAQRRAGDHPQQAGADPARRRVRRVAAGAGARRRRGASRTPPVGCTRQSQPDGRAEEGEARA